MDCIQLEFLAPVDAAQLAGRGMRRSYLRVADAGIIALIELVKFYQNYRAGFGVDGDLSEILKDFDEPSNLRAEFGIVKAFGTCTDLEVAFLICVKFVCCSLPAARSLWAMVLSRKSAKIAQ